MFLGLHGSLGTAISLYSQQKPTAMDGNCLQITLSRDFQQEPCFCGWHHLTCSWHNWTLHCDCHAGGRWCPHQGNMRHSKLPYPRPQTRHDIRGFSKRHRHQRQEYSLISSKYSHDPADKVKNIKCFQTAARHISISMERSFKNALKFRVAVHQHWQYFQPALPQQMQLSCQAQE